MENNENNTPNPGRRAGDKYGIEREGGLFSPEQRRDYLAWKAGLSQLAEWLNPTQEAPHE